MSERMSNDKFIKILKELSNHELIMFKNDIDETSESEYTNIDIKQALQIAIRQNEWHDMIGNIKPENNEEVVVQLDDCFYIATYENDKAEYDWWFEDFDYTEKEINDYYKIHKWKRIEPYERKE